MAVEDPTKKQIEEVDPEVAKILGLEDNFDLEYDEYMQLLRETIVKSSFDEKSKLSEDDLAKLANERKRIRDLKGSKFTAAKKGINVDSFFNKKPQGQGTNQKPVTDPAKLLSGSGGALANYQPPEPEQEQEKQVDNNSKKIGEIEKFLNGSLLDIVKEIRGLTESILSILQKQSSADKKGSELSRREREKTGKEGKEKDLEGKKEEKKGLGLINKILKPFTSIFDTIKNFIMMVLLGSLVNWLFTVLQNPMTLLKPIQGLIDGITGFFNTVIQFIDKMVVQPVRNFIDAINSALNGFIGLLNGALKMLPGSPQIGSANIPNIPQAPELQAPNITGEPKNPEPKPTAGPPINLKFTGGEVRPPKVVKKETGGSIPGNAADRKKLSFNDTVSREGGNVSSKTTSFNVSGLGPDKHLTALSTGEYVLKKGAADWLGGPVYLDNINKMFGGTTERKVANLGDIKIEAKSTGGQIGGSSGSNGARGSSGSSGSNGARGSSGASSSGGSSNGFKIGDRIFSPTEYSKNVISTRYITVGKNPPKSYVLGYVRDSASSGKYTIKMVNKLVSSAGLGKLVGKSDELTGVLPSSPEGQSILKSANVADYFRTVVGTAKMFKLELKYDKDADIQYWYNQAYQTHYNDWKDKLGVSDEKAKQMASVAAAEFAISKSKGSKGSWLPGSPQSKAPESLRYQGVETDNLSGPASADSPAADAPKDDKTLKFDDAALTSGTIYGDPAKDSYASPSTPLIPTGPGSRNPQSETGEPKKSTQSQPSTPLIPSSPPSSSSLSEDQLNKMSVDQLSKMLDPSKVGASNPAVFEAATRAREEGKAQGLTGEVLEKKVLIASILAKKGGASSAVSSPTTSPSIAPGKPPNIPGVPESQPSVSMLPLPSVGKGGNPQSGMTKTGSTPVVYFNSYDSSEAAIITTAALYNIWGM
jgi:uncharacterized membrane protein YgcG